MANKTKSAANTVFFPDMESRSEEVNYKKNFCEKYFDKSTWSLDVLNQVDVLLQDKRGRFLLYIESKHRITNEQQDVELLPKLSLPIKSKKPY